MPGELEPTNFRLPKLTPTDRPKPPHVAAKEEFISRFKERIPQEAELKVYDVLFEPGHAAGEGMYRVIVSAHVSLKRHIAKLGFSEEEAKGFTRIDYRPAMDTWYVPVDMLNRKFPKLGEMSAEQFTGALNAIPGFESATVRGNPSGRDIAQQDEIVIEGVVVNTDRSFLVGKRSAGDSTRIGTRHHSDLQRAIHIPERRMNEVMGVAPGANLGT